MLNKDANTKQKLPKELEESKKISPPPSNLIIIGASTSGIILSLFLIVGAIRLICSLIESFNFIAALAVPCGFILGIPLLLLATSGLVAGIASLISSRPSFDDDIAPRAKVALNHPDGLRESKLSPAGSIIISTVCVITSLAMIASAGYLCSQIKSFFWLSVVGLTCQIVLGLAILLAGAWTLVTEITNLISPKSLVDDITLKAPLNPELMRLKPGFNLNSASQFPEQASVVESSYENTLRSPLVIHSQGKKAALHSGQIEQKPSLNLDGTSRAKSHEHISTLENAYLQYLKALDDNQDIALGEKATLHPGQAEEDSTPNPNLDRVYKAQFHKLPCLHAYMPN